MVVLLLVVFHGLLVTASAAPATEHNSRTFRNALNQQGLQTILQSIEERLRNLDQIYSVRYASPNINTDQIIRKIEILENKLSRMETQMEAQLEKISENMSSKNFKDDIARDQLFRKTDSVYERINHKLSYVEGRIDMDILKLQTKVEAGISKIERLDHSFSVRQADMEAEVSDAVEMMESVKDNVASIENKLMNITKNTIENTFTKQTNMIHSKLDNVTNLITQIDMKVNNSLEQCYQKDGLNDFNNKDTQITKTFKGYEDQIQNYGNKVSNMYNELWKKSTTLENTMKHSVLLMNLTRKDIQELKKAGHKFTTYNSQNDGQLEIIVDSFTNTIQRKFAELGRKLESNIENVIQLQNLFLESCHRIQEDESQLENKISLVLEKLLDAVTNRSINTFKEIQSVEELIKSHDTNVYRTLNQNTNTIIKLSEKTSEDRKKLEKNLSTIKKDIGNALETIQNEISSEDQENSQKFDTVASILLELQEQVNDLDSGVNEDNINYNAKQILHDILLVTKGLPDANTLNTTILQNVEDLTKLMTSIYHLLTSIDSKINMDYHQNTTNTKYPANITQESTTVSEVTEPVHFVLEIFPENDTTLLGRFNYTLITDYDEKSPSKKDNGIIINANSYAGIPQASTITNIEKTTENAGVIIKQNNFEIKTTKNKEFGTVINGLSTSDTATKKYLETKFETIDESDHTKQTIDTLKTSETKNGLLTPDTVTKYLETKFDTIDESNHTEQNNFQKETIDTQDYRKNGLSTPGTVTTKYLETKNDNIETIEESDHTKQNNFQKETIDTNEKRTPNTTETPSSVSKKYLETKNDNIDESNHTKDHTKQNNFQKEAIDTNEKRTPNTTETPSTVAKKYLETKNVIETIDWSDHTEQNNFQKETIDTNEKRTPSTVTKKYLETKNDNIETIDWSDHTEQNNFQKETIDTNEKRTPSTVTKKYLETKNDNTVTIDESDHTKQNNFKEETINKNEEINGNHVIVEEKIMSTPSTEKEEQETNKKDDYIPKTATEQNIVNENDLILSKPPNKNEYTQNNLEIESNINEEYSSIIVNSNRNMPTLPKPETVPDTVKNKPAYKNDENENPFASAHDTAEYSKNDTKHTASAEMKENIGQKGFSSSAQRENSGDIINAHTEIEPEENIAVSNNENFSNATIADIPVSDVTIKSVKIESVTKPTTEIFDYNLESATAHAMNSFEYTDLKNNTNDEYEWDYDE